MAAPTASVRSVPVRVAAALLLAFPLVVGVAPAPTEAATLSVCPSGCDFATIQEAVDAAVSEDTIAIGAGTYTENVRVEGPAGFTLHLQGAGAATTVLDGGGEDIALRVGAGTVVTVADLTIRHGATPDYGGGTAYWEITILVNLEPVRTFAPYEELDTNFAVVGTGGGALVERTAGDREYFAYWGQSFTVPEDAPAEPVEAFRFLRADGTTPAGAGTGYLFEGGMPAGYVGADDLATQAYDAAGAWDGTWFDLSASAFTLTPGETYVFLVDEPFTAGALDRDAADNCGGGVNVLGSLTVTDAEVVDNVSATSGAGICVSDVPDGPLPGPGGDVGLELVRTTVSGNVASGDGGGIFTGAGVPTLVLTDSTIADNHADIGGGIHAGESLSGSTAVTISGSSIRDNVAQRIGGGLYSGIAAYVTLTDSEVTGNEAVGFHGGGIANSGYVYAVSQLTVERTTVSGNTAGSDGGGIFSGNPYGVGGYARLGLVDSTVSGNVAGSEGGGIRTTGVRAEITNSTLSGNTAATGGGLSADAFPSSPLPDPALVTSSTITGNAGGGVHNAWMVELHGTIVAGNAGGDCTGVISGPLGVGITSLGWNLDADGTCPLDGVGDLSGVDPLLGPLQDNGGATWTHEPSPTSPAVDPDFGYAEGQAYLSGGATYTPQPSGDVDFRITTGVGETIAEMTEGTRPIYSIFGQSFTTPPGTLALDVGEVVLLGADGTTAVGAGVAYLFDHEYDGLVADLRTSDALAAAPWDATASVYDFSGAGLALQPGAVHWLYIDEPVTAGYALADCPVATDQRGVSRPRDGDGDGWATCDIGAVEVLPPSDTTPPVVTPVVSGTLGLAGWYVSDVHVSWTITDPESLITSTDGCDPVVVDEDTAGRALVCTATSRGGTTTGSVTVARDTTPPSVTWVGAIADGDVLAYGEVPPEPTCTATDATSGPASCVVSGYGTSVGAHTLTALAADTAGNTASDSRTYTVEGWSLLGFHPPIAMDAINEVRAGATVPMKFEVLAGPTELTDVDVVSGIEVVAVACPGEAAASASRRTGPTVLRYDAEEGQFVLTWRTPRVRGACYDVTVTTVDGSSLTAAFHLS